MAHKLHIAAFNSDSPGAMTFLDTLEKYDCTLHRIQDVSEAAAVALTVSGIDVCVVPLRCTGGQSASAITLQLRAHDQLSTTPIICVSPGTDKNVVRALYGVGADLVLLPPHDTDLIFFQIEALARQRQMFTEQLREAKTAIGLNSATIGALDAAGTPIALFTLDRHLQFANAALCDLLGTRDGAAAAKCLQALDVVLQSAARNEISSKDIELPRADGRLVPVTVRRADICGPEGDLLGIALAISERAEIALLQAQVAHTDRLEGLSLLLAAGWMQVLKDIQVDPFARLQSVLETTKREANGALVFGHLLEFLDQLLPATLHVALRAPSEWRVNVSAPDLFQLTGLLTLYAASQVGYFGELTVEVGERDDPDGVRVTWYATSERPIPIERDTTLQAALRRRFAEDGESLDSKSPPRSILEAQAIADRYGSSVQYGWREDGALKLRVVLPRTIT